MFTKTKTALAVTLVLGSTSLALAQGFDPNLANRYPHLANPNMYGYVAGAHTPQRMDQAPNAAFQSAPVQLRQGRAAGANTSRRSDQAPIAAFQSAPVQLRQGRNVGVTNPGNYSGQESWFDIDRNDRASSPYAGGGF
jgi:hypothetical protein